MIISLRGTHGSGKSHLVRTILERYNAVPESTDTKGRPLTYVATLSNKCNLYIVGNYKNACGGCDGIQPYSRIWPIVERLATKEGHVLVEGAMVSSSYGNIGRASEKYGDKMVFVFLDTPVEECIRRITDRRKARGDERPLNPKSTIGKHRNVTVSIAKIRDYYKRPVVMLDYRKALPQILGLLYRGVIS
jgi:hypothetical protein